MYGSILGAPRWQKGIVELVLCVLLFGIAIYVAVGYVNSLRHAEVKKAQCVLSGGRVRTPGKSSACLVDVYELPPTNQTQQPLARDLQTDVQVGNELCENIRDRDVIVCYVDWNPKTKKVTVVTLYRWVIMFYIRETPGLYYLLL